jgi:phenylpropionate dioxygenase-like ring-hydroxylating dioxygenase large terminal subunit
VSIPPFFRFEQERVFGRTWQPVGYARDVVKPGEYFACEITGTGRR